MAGRGDGFDGHTDEVIEYRAGFVEGVGDFVGGFVGDVAGAAAEAGPDVLEKDVLDVVVEIADVAQQMLLGLDLIPAAETAAAVHRGVAGDRRHEPGSDTLGDVVHEPPDTRHARAEALDEIFTHVDIVDRGDDIDDIREDANLLADRRTHTIDLDDPHHHHQIAVQHNQQIGGFIRAERHADHDIPHRIPHLPGRRGVERFQHGPDMGLLDRAYHGQHVGPAGRRTLEAGQAVGQMGDFPLAEVGIGHKPPEIAAQIANVLFELFVGGILEIGDHRRPQRLGKHRHIAPDIDDAPAQQPQHHRQKGVTGDGVHRVQNLKSPQDFQYGKKRQQHANDDDSSPNQFPDRFQHTMAPFVL